jgi:hypothetical protein
MTVATKVLGPFEVGQQPTITAHLIDISGGTAVATGTHWIVQDPDDNEVEFTSPDPAIAEVDDNIWTLLMPVITMDGLYWVTCEAIGPLVATHRQRVGVVQVP